MDAGGPQQVSVQPVPATPTSPEVNQPAKETWATFVSASLAGPAAIIVEYNDRDNVLGMARSTGGPFTQCVAQNCGPSGGPIPPAPLQGTQVLGGVTVGLYAGDPAISGDVAPAGTAGTGVVVATNIAVSQAGQVPDMLVAITSFDGGQTFVQSDQVNAGNTPCDGGAGMPDQQAIAFDSRGPAFRSTFWIGWRQLPPNGQTFFCVRGVRVNPTTLAVTFLGPSQVVPTEQPLERGAGGLLLQARGGRVTVVYSNDDAPAGFTLANCPPWGITWLSIDGRADGAGVVTWSPGRIIHLTSQYDTCFGGNQLTHELRSFGFGGARDGRQLLAIHDTPGSVRVFTRRLEDMPWTQEHRFLSTETVGGPALAVDLDGNVAVSFYKGVLPNETRVERVVALREDATGLWTLPESLSTSTVGVPVPDTVGRGWGDYQGITLVDDQSFGTSRTFFVVWSDTDPIFLLQTVLGSPVGLGP